MEGHIVHQSKIKFRDCKNNWKTRWAILEKSDRNLPPEDENARNSNYTSLVIRKHKEGEVKLAIPLYYLCVVDKYIVDKKAYGIVLVVANKMDTGETYLVQGDTNSETDVWHNYFQSIVGAGMHKFQVKLPKIVKWKYNGPGYLYFYEEQRFITITDDKQFPKLPTYVGTWPIQLLRRYGGDDPNKFVFESGRRCFGSVNYYHVASPQAYDIKALCNKVSSARTNMVPASGSLANTTLPGYADNEPRYRHHPGPGPRPRPLTGASVASNGSVTSNGSKRSSGSSSGGDMFRQQSLDRGVRPPSDTIDSGISFRSSNNSILSNRSHSSRGSGSFSDVGVVEDDSGVDTLDSKGTFMSAPDSKDADPGDMYMVMQPTLDPARTGTMPPISETAGSVLADGPSEVYELMGQHPQDGYTTLRNNSNNWQEVQIGESNYMVTKPTTPIKTKPVSPPCSQLSSPFKSQPSSPFKSQAGSLQSPTSPNGVKPKLINYPPLPSPTLAQSPTDNYMNMRDINPAPARSNYVNINSIPSAVSTPAEPSCYMNVDLLAQSMKTLNMDNGQQLYTNIGHIEYPKATPAQPAAGGGSYGNYMNMSLMNTEVPQAPIRKGSLPEQPIYDTPKNHVRAYANVDNKMIAMSVSNPIYGNTAQKLKT